MRMIFESIKMESMLEIKELSLKDIEICLKKVIITFETINIKDQMLVIQTMDGFIIIKTVNRKKKIVLIMSAEEEEKTLNIKTIIGLLHVINAMCKAITLETALKFTIILKHLIAIIVRMVLEDKRVIILTYRVLSIVPSILEIQKCALGVRKMDMIQRIALKLILKVVEVLPILEKNNIFITATAKMAKNRFEKRSLITSMIMINVKEPIALAQNMVRVIVLAAKLKAILQENALFFRHISRSALLKLELAKTMKMEYLIKG